MDAINFYDKNEKEMMSIFIKIKYINDDIRMDFQLVKYANETLKKGRI